MLGRLFELVSLNIPNSFAGGVATVLSETWHSQFHLNEVL